MNTSEEIKLPHDIACSSEDVKRRYRGVVMDGVGARFAEMCALQSPPSTSGTDRTFMQGRYNNEQFAGMAPDHAKGMISQARRAGVNPNGKYFCAGLADKRGAGDPSAWVDSVADVKRVAEKKNLTIRGAINHSGTPVPRPESKRLSESLTKEMMQVEKHRHPTMKQGELKEYVVDKYSRKKKK